MIEQDGMKVFIEIPYMLVVDIKRAVDVDGADNQLAQIRLLKVLIVTRKTI